MKEKVYIILSLLCSITQFIYAQYQITIDVNVKDKQSLESIPFVSINFKGKPIKTVSDTNGRIAFSYDEEAVLLNDTLIIDAIGYKTQKIATNQLYRFLQNSNTIYLESNESAINKALGKGNIYGKVTTNNAALQGVSITVKGSMYQSLTDNEGNYRIHANPDDVLVFKFLGTKNQEIGIGSNSNINVDLEPDGELLDEVLLQGQVKKEATIDLGKNESKSFDELGFSVSTMNEKDIGSQYQSFQDLLQGKFAGLRMAMPYNVSAPPIIYLRNNNSANNEIPAIYDIDGSIYQTWPNIDVQNIKNITILRSLAAVTKYGTIGRGGVIVIKTKTASGTKAEAKKPSLLATGNDYTEQVQELDVLNHEPGYLQTLKNAKSFKEAKQIYKILKQTKDNLSIAYYLDAAEYFLKWDKAYALDIFRDAEDLAKDNAKALKSIAFRYEALNRYEKARLVYQRITLLMPTDAQSYRDLALIYVSTGYYNEAMRLYKQMLSNGIKDVDFSGLQQPITDELMHLLATHRSKVDYTDIPADVLAAKFKQDLRIVFAWNNPTAEFELQFVNPQKKFFKWSHTKFDNRERMLDEIKKGYTSEAYIIDDADTGEWIINLESLNEIPDINPNYLKYTIYKNYGLPNETKTVKVIQLENIKQKVTLDKFMYE